MSKDRLLPRPGGVATTDQLTWATSTAGTSEVRANGPGSPGRRGSTGTCPETVSIRLPSAAEREACTSAPTGSGPSLRTRPHAPHEPCDVIITESLRSVSSPALKVWV